MPDELNGAAPVVTESTVAPVEAPSAPVESTSSEPAARSFHEIADAVWDKHNPPRDGGKFTSRNGDAPVEAAPGTETPDQPEEQGTEPGSTDQVRGPAIDPPRSWSAEMQAKFAALPPDVRQYVAERDKEVFRQVSQMGAQVKAIEPVRTVLEQHRDYLQRIGRTPEDAVTQLFKASRSLDQNPAATLKWLADAYKVDLRQLALNQQQAPAVTQTDPRLEARLRRMEAEAAQRTQAEQTAREQNIASTIEKYASDNKSHPHFNDLEDEIIRQLPGIRQSDPYLSPEQMLDQAYEKAKWAHPTVRQRILMDQQKADEAKRKAEQDKQIKEARRHGSLNQTSNGKGSTPVKGSIRDSLMRHADRLMGS
jgi:hypothetical protein